MKNAVIAWTSEALGRVEDNKRQLCGSQAATWTGRYWSVKPLLCAKYGLGADLPEEAVHEEEDPEGLVVAGRRGRGASHAAILYSQTELLVES